MAWVALDAPTNLGLRPPAPGCVPGCAKAAGALRDHGLLRRLGAVDAGCVTPGRYVPTWAPGDGLRNRDAIVAYTAVLASRVGAQLDGFSAGDHLLVLGGDCSVLPAVGLALRRRGRTGLVFVDAHDDFRHVGNAPHVGAAAGEDLALATGFGDPGVTDIDGLSPYFSVADVAVVGARVAPDDNLDELRHLGALVRTGTELRHDPEGVAAAALGHVGPRFFVHFDADVLDASVMPAVDSPESDGPGFAEAARLLRVLVSAPGCVGVEVTIYDPDLDPTGAVGAALVDCLVEALGV